ncbi:hypothetical protein DESC_540016 [Desulfosarcina cetonica]|nr:hypothetical protein DESC_540016 [Desulfosarcina cetonica]
MDINLLDVFHYRHLKPGPFYIVCRALNKNVDSLWWAFNKNVQFPNDWNLTILHKVRELDIYIFVFDCLPDNSTVPDETIFQYLDPS